MPPNQSLQALNDAGAAASSAAAADLLYIVQGGTSKSITFALLEASLNLGSTDPGYTPGSGYTPTSATIAGHYEGIDLAFQGIPGATDPDDLQLSFVPSDYTLPGGNDTLGGGHLPGIDNELGDHETRITSLEGATTDASVVTYTPAVLTDWDGDADPGDVDEALDQLAERVDDLEVGGAGGPGEWKSIHIETDDDYTISNVDETFETASLGITYARDDPGNEIDITLPAGNWGFDVVILMDGTDVPSFTDTGFTNFHETKGFTSSGTARTIHAHGYKTGAGVVSISGSSSTNTFVDHLIKITKMP